MTRELVVSEIAKLDLEIIHANIAQHNQVAADQLMVRIQSACLMLIERPFTGSKFGDDHPGVRFRTVGRYVIYYRVFDEMIWVERVLHGARDANRIL
jgi:plasmid stabilization system protein ParE